MRRAGSVEDLRLVEARAAVPYSKAWAMRAAPLCRVDGRSSGISGNPPEHLSIQHGPERLYEVVHERGPAVAVRMQAAHGHATLPRSAQ
jgi:hypothetical protein